MAIADALRRRNPRYCIIQHMLAQVIDDSLRGGSVSADDARDEAHGWATWLYLILKDPNDDPGGQDDLDILTQKLDDAGICIREFSEMLMDIVDLVEIEGPAYPPEHAIEPTGGALASLLGLDELDDQLSDLPAIHAEIKRQLLASAPKPPAVLDAAEPQQISLF